ncbi:hypothetical protein Aperf_G00000036872 [Anoplocephala perfoliata]
MALPVVEVDKEGREIFFKSPVDISKPSEQNASELNSLHGVNDLHLHRRLPVPRFRGYVYNYSFFLILCSRNDRDRLEVKKKIGYDSIVATHPCEQDPTIVFLIVTNSKGRYLVRLLKFPSAIIGTNFRYVIDQLQMSPIHEVGYPRRGSARTTDNSGSSWSTPRAEESDASVTSALHHFRGSAAHNPTMRAFYEREESEIKLPRVKPFVLNPSMHNSRSSQRRNDVFDNFHSAGYEIYRPVSRASRIDRSERAESLRRPLSRRQRSRARREIPGVNYNSRAAVRNMNHIYLQPENEDYRTASRNYQNSRSGSVSRRVPPY